MVKYFKIHIDFLEAYAVLNKNNLKCKEKEKSKKTSIPSKIFGIFLWSIIICAVVVLGLNSFVCISTNSQIKRSEEIGDKTVDCIMVLGCGVSGSTPSPMLKDRLDKAIELYKKGAAEKLLMSGDHGGEYYNEVGAMKIYAIKNGVPSEDIFMDHAGFSTYESLYRAKELFGCQNLITVTQRYHLYRTVFLGNSLNIDICGVETENYNYGGMLYREMREILARDKDVFTAMINPKPTVPIGDKIDISTSGDVTNDEAFLQMAKNNNIEIE